VEPNGLTVGAGVDTAAAAVFAPNENGDAVVAGAITPNGDGVVVVVIDDELAEWAEFAEFAPNENPPEG